MFDEVLSAAQIENIRQNGVASAVTASEPGSFALVGVLAFLLARRRRGQSEPRKRWMWASGTIVRFFHSAY